MACTTGLSTGPCPGDTGLRFGALTLGVSRAYLAIAVRVRHCVPAIATGIAAACFVVASVLA